MEISIGILAGGKSVRMGQNKAFLKLNGNSFLDTLLEEFNAFEDIIISVDSIEKYPLLQHKAVEDKNLGIGPIEGIYQIISHSKNEFVFICGTDMPFLKRQLAEYITTFISHDYSCYVIVEGGKINPLCAIYSKNILPVLKQLISDKTYRLRSIFEMASTKYISIDKSGFSPGLIRNINTKDDYALFVSQDSL